MDQKNVTVSVSFVLTAQEALLFKKLKGLATDEDINSFIEQEVIRRKDEMISVYKRQIAQDILENDPDASDIINALKNADTDKRSQIKSILAVSAVGAITDEEIIN